MIAQTSFGVIEMPHNGLLMLAGWVLSCLIFGWGGYRWWLCAQNEAEKRKARNEVLAIIERLMADNSKIFNLQDLYMDSKEVMRDAVFRFSGQLDKTARCKLEETWTGYDNIKFDGHWSPTEGNPDTEKFKNDQKIMLESLKKLREEICKS